MQGMLIVLCSGLVLGVLSALAGKFFDSLMDYGSLLGFVRYKLAKRYANPEVKIQLELALEYGDYAERLTRMNDLYWEVATKNFWFTGWVCLVCLSSRVATILTAISIPFMLKNHFDIWGIFATYFTALVVCHFIISKI